MPNPFSQPDAEDAARDRATNVWINRVSPGDFILTCVSCGCYTTEWFDALEPRCSRCYESRPINAADVYETESTLP